VIYADMTRQQRIRRAGYQGWTANLGVRIRFWEIAPACGWESAPKTGAAR